MCPVCVLLCVARVSVWSWSALQFALQDLNTALANTPRVHPLFVLYCIVYYKSVCGMAAWPVSHTPCRPDELFLTVQCIALFAPGVFVLGAVCLVCVGGCGGGRGALTMPRNSCLHSSGAAPRGRPAGALELLPPLLLHPERRLVPRFVTEMNCCT